MNIYKKYLQIQETNETKRITNKYCASRNIRWFHFFCYEIKSIFIKKRSYMIHFRDYDMTKFYLVLKQQNFNPANACICASTVNNIFSWLLKKVYYHEDLIL